MQAHTTVLDSRPPAETAPAALRDDAELQLYKVRHPAPAPAGGPAVQYVLAANLDEALAGFTEQFPDTVPSAVELIDPVTIQATRRPQCFKFVIDGATYVVLSEDMTAAWAHLRRRGITRAGHWQLEVTRLSEQVLVCGPGGA